MSRPISVRLVLHPSELRGHDLSRSSVVVFDVLRATTTIVTALAHGAAEVRAFAEMDDARAAHAPFEGKKLLAGERGCLPPAGFDVGNSPVSFTPARVAAATIFLSTTNGTRAIRACETARHTFVASLCNATATARRLVEFGDDVVLVCAGVDGAPGGEDIDGAATVADAMRRRGAIVEMRDGFEKLARERSCLDLSAAEGLTRLLASPGGANLLRVGLREDIEFCAKVDRFETVAEVTHHDDFATIQRLSF